MHNMNVFDRVESELIRVYTLDAMRKSFEAARASRVVRSLPEVHKVDGGRRPRGPRTRYRAAREASKVLLQIQSKV